MGGLGRLLGGLWEAFGALVASWRLLGGRLIDFWGLSDGFWAPWVSFWEALLINNRSNFDVFFDIIVDVICDCFLNDF